MQWETCLFLKFIWHNHVRKLKPSQKEKFSSFLHRDKSLSETRENCNISIYIQILCIQKVHNITFLAQTVKFLPKKLTTPFEALLVGLIAIIQTTSHIQIKFSLLFFLLFRRPTKIKMVKLNKVKIAKISSTMHVLSNHFLSRLLQPFHLGFYVFTNFCLTFWLSVFVPWLSFYLAICTFAYYWAPSCPSPQVLIGSCIWFLGAGEGFPTPSPIWKPDVCFKDASMWWLWNPVLCFFSSF